MPKSAFLQASLEALYDIEMQILRQVFSLTQKKLFCTNEGYQTDLLHFTREQSRLVANLEFEKNIFYFYFFHLPTKI